MINNRFDQLYKKVINEWMYDDDGDLKYDLSDDEIHPERYYKERFISSIYVVNLCRIKIKPSDDNTYKVLFQAIDYNINTHDTSYAIKNYFNFDNVIPIDNNYNNTDKNTIELGKITKEQYISLLRKYKISNIEDFVFFIYDWIDGGKFERTDESTYDIELVNDDDYNDPEFECYDSYAVLNNTEFDSLDTAQDLFNDILTLCNATIKNNLTNIELLSDELINDWGHDIYEAGNFDIYY